MSNNVKPRLAAVGDHTVAIIGLGYVGLTLAAVMADVDVRVVGIEIREEVLSALAAGRAHFHEAGIDERIGSHLRSGRLSVAKTLDGADRPTAYIITVGTPIGPDKCARTDAIEGVAQMIAARLMPDDLVVLRSTVRVGVTREVVKPILDHAGVPYHLAFCPERTIEGRALRELRDLPQVVGGLNDASCHRAAALFRQIASEVVEMESLEAAELVKLINNTERDLRFAFANEIAAMCDVLGLSAHDVIKASNHRYPRSNLAYPGPVGGPCLTKDPFILAEGLRARGLEPALALAGRATNEAVIVDAVASVCNALRQSGANAEAPRIAILGVAFKGRPATDDLRGSTVIELINAIRATYPTAKIAGFDPVASPTAVAALGIEAMSSVDDTFRGTSIVFIHNNHEALANLPIARLGLLMRRPGIVYDFWGQNRQTTRLPDDVIVTGLGYWPASLQVDAATAWGRHVA